MTIPKSLAPVVPYLKLYEELKKRDTFISYFCGLYAIQKALKLNLKSSECMSFLSIKMTELEKVKSEITSSDAEIVASKDVSLAYISNYISKLFDFADEKDRSSTYNNSIVKAFYTVTLLYDVMTLHGELTEDDIHRKQYSKWRATYINKCIQNGEIPEPPPSAQSASYTSEENSFEPKQPVQSTEQTYSITLSKPSTIKTTETPVTSAVSSNSYVTQNITDPKLTSKEAIKAVMDAKKLCSYALSSLEFTEIRDSINYLEKAINLLKPYS